MGSDYLKGLQEGVTGRAYIFKVPPGDSVQPGLGVTLFLYLMLNTSSLGSQAKKQQLWLDRQCDSRYTLLRTQN